MSSNRLRIGIDNATIVAEIHHTHLSLQNIKSFIKENFAEYYFGRSNIIMYQDILASKELNEKREKLVNWFVKNAGIEESNPILAKRVLENYKKQIKIKIGIHDVMQDITTIRILKVDEEILSLEVRRDSGNIIFNYLKSRFLFALSNYDKDNNKLYIFTNSDNFKDMISNILNKKSIVGKKVIFIYDRKYIESITKNRFEYKKANNSRASSDSLREYMAKIRNSYLLLELSNQIKDLNTIKKQYYKMAKKLHPDNYYCENEYTVERYKNQFMQVKEAYEVLKEYVEKRSA